MTTASKFLGRWQRWLIGIALLIGLSGLAWDASLTLRPIYKRKTVTLRAETGQLYKVVFSAKQADPEVIYEIKTRYQGQFDRELDSLNGHVDDTPYAEFTQHALQRQLISHGSAGLGLLALTAAWMAATKFLSRRRARLS